MSGPLYDRLEMIIVMRWLDDGASDAGTLALEVEDTAEELGLEVDRQGVLSVMTALGALEERGAITVEWSRGLRRDAKRLFGRDMP